MDRPVEVGLFETLFWVPDYLGTVKKRIKKLHLTWEGFKMCRFMLVLIFLPAHSKKLLRHNQRFSSLIV